MSDILIFNGFIKDVQYHACLTDKLNSYHVSRFDINLAKTYGLIEFDNENGKYIIQESKNSTKNFIPAVSDIKDGLFKLILFANIDSLQINQHRVDFSTKLKLTGCCVEGNLQFPCSDEEFQNFLDINSHHIKSKNKEILQKLRLEARYNQNLVIEIGGSDQ